MISPQRVRQRAAQLLETKRSDDALGRAINIFLIILIALNVLVVILSTMPSFEQQYGAELHVFNVFSVLIFTVEYLARVWCCIDTPEYAGEPLWRMRLRYMVSPLAVVDLLAFLPFYLSFIIAIDLRFLRVVRLLRIFKLARYWSALTVVLNVLREESAAFGAAFFVLVVLLVLASSGIYLIEHDVQPEAFGSIPAAMWWAMATLTTVGYGDVTPITPWGKFFGGCVTVIGMGMVALPAGILASGFADHIHRSRERYKEHVAQALVDGVVSKGEREQLEMLRETLGLSEEEADDLIQRGKAASGNTITCPHCEKRINLG